MSEQHGRNGYLRGCRCDVCRAGQPECIAAQRARKRALKPVPAAEPETGRATSAETVGPVVAAVRADVARLGVAHERVLCAAAEQMGRILDDPWQVTTQPSACGKLM